MSARLLAGLILLLGLVQGVERPGNDVSEWLARMLFKRAGRALTASGT